VNSDLSCFLYRGRLKRSHLHCRASYRLDLPLSFVSRRPCIWYMGHSEANKRSTDSKRTATGGNNPAHNGPIFGQSRADSRKWRNSFPGIEKKNRDSRLSSLVNIPNIRHWNSNQPTSMPGIICFYGILIGSAIFQQTDNGLETYQSHPHNCQPRSR